MMLVGVTLLWGLSFPLVKTWQMAAHACPDGKLASTFTLLAIRMLLASVVLIVIYPKLLLTPTRKEHGIGALLGGLMFVSLSLQFTGLVWASPATSAFLTSLGSAWVPLFAWVGLGLIVPRLTLIGLFVGVIGVAVLTLRPEQRWSLGPGELLTLGSTFPFTMQILVLDHVGKKVRSTHLTLGLLGTTGGLALVGVLLMVVMGSGMGSWLDWLGQMLTQWKIVLTLIALVLLPTVLAFHWMNQYQPQVSPGHAALIYLLEPLFTTLISIPWGYDKLSYRLILGGGLILFGHLIVEWRALRARGQSVSSS